MADPAGSISLVPLLVELLSDHVPKEAKFIEQKRQQKWWPLFESDLNRPRADNAKLPEEQRLTDEELKAKAQQLLLESVIQRRSKQTIGGDRGTKAEGTVIEQAEAELKSLSGPKPEQPVWETTPWEIAVRWLAQRSAFFHGINTPGVTPIDRYESLLREHVADVRRGGPIGSNEAAAELLEFERQGLAVQLYAELGNYLSPSVQAQLQPAGDTPTRKQKRSTEKGEGQAKLIAALTKHHEYADGSCLNLEPVGNNELATLAGVSPSTASTFFNKEFDGHTKYRAACGDATQLVAALKLLNQEFSPHHLYGAKPPGEVERKDEG